MRTNVVPMARVITVPITKSCLLITLPVEAIVSIARSLILASAVTHTCEFGCESSWDPGAHRKSSTQSFASLASRVHDPLGGVQARKAGTHDRSCGVRT